MNAAIYLRVSGKRQDEENQIADCRRLCETRGWLAPIHAREVGSAVKNRPVWRELLIRAHRGEIGAVVVWSLDRMGRDMFGILKDWEALKAVGCKLVSTREPWLGGDVGEVEDLLMAVLGWAAQFERRRMLQRVRAAHDRIRHNLATTGQHVTKAGKTIRRFGRPSALTKEQRSHLEALAETAVNPNISALARLYRVSRATVRAALAESRSKK